MVQTWGILFDNGGNLYAASNNSNTGGLARSTDKGKTWTRIMTGIDLSAGCGSFRSLGLAPDGTIFTINQICPGKQHFAYWLDNVSGTGTNWTKATIVGDSGVISSGGMENGCAIAANGTTIICPTASQLTLLSNDNGRAWTPAATSPAGTQEQLFAVTVGGVSYETVASADVPTVSNTWYSLDNGSTWTALPTPGNLSGALDAWTGAEAGAGANGGEFMYYQGNSGANTGFYCWNSTPPAGSWVFCGNHQDVGQPSNYVTMMAINRPHPTTGVFYISMKPGDIWATTATQDH